MSYTEKLPIFQKTYDLIKQVHIYLPKFPKREQFTLGAKIDNLLFEFLGFIIEANQKAQKFDSLTKASVALNKLRIFVRLAKDLKCLSFKQYKILQEMIDEIGKMLGGWIKYS